MRQIIFVRSYGREAAREPSISEEVSVSRAHLLWIVLRGGALMLSLRWIVLGRRSLDKYARLSFMQIVPAVEEVIFILVSARGGRSVGKKVL